MRVTKYPQSCLVVENDAGGRLLVDPGDFAMDAYTIDDFGHIDAVLYTHRHPDHFDERHVDALLERGITLHGNEDVAGLIGDEAQVVHDGEPFEAAGSSITPRDLPHVELVDGSPGPPNTGYVIDEQLFHPGDGISLPGLSIERLALPIAGPSISFRRAHRFIEEIGASKVVPMHFDMFCADPELFDSFCEIAEVVILEPGESAEL